jgi:hypothetical protein
LIDHRIYSEAKKTVLNVGSDHLAGLECLQSDVVGQAFIDTYYAAILLTCLFVFSFYLEIGSERVIFVLSGLEC